MSQVTQRPDPQQLIDTFRRNHQDPVNLAMHVAGFFLIWRGFRKLIRGRVKGALFRAGLGTALLVGGHRLEGTDPFAVIREARGNGGQAVSPS